MYGPNSSENISLDVMFLNYIQIFHSKPPNKTNRRTSGEFQRVFNSIISAIWDMIMRCCHAVSFELESTLKVLSHDIDLSLSLPAAPGITVTPIEAYAIVHLEDTRQIDVLVPAVLH